MHNSQAILYLFYFDLSSLFLMNFMKTLSFYDFLGVVKQSKFIYDRLHRRRESSEPDLAAHKHHCRGRMVRTTEGNAVSGR